MDITLERILSLLPKKEDGGFVRGSKKDFAINIGYDSGDIVSMWIKGTSESYKGKLHEIAAKYDVSVAWLKGETDTKKEPTQAGAFNPVLQEILNRVEGMTPEQLRLTLEHVKMIEDLRK